MLGYNNLPITIEEQDKTMEEVDSFTPGNVETDRDIVDLKERQYNIQGNKDTLKVREELSTVFYDGEATLPMDEKTSSVEIPTTVNTETEEEITFKENLETTKENNVNEIDTPTVDEVITNKDDDKTETEDLEYTTAKSENLLENALVEEHEKRKTVNYNRRFRRLEYEEEDSEKYEDMDHLDEQEVEDEEARQERTTESVDIKKREYNIEATYDKEEKPNSVLFEKEDNESSATAKEEEQEKKSDEDGEDEESEDGGNKKNISKVKS